VSLTDRLMTYISRTPLKQSTAVLLHVSDFFFFSTACAAKWERDSREYSQEWSKAYGRVVLSSTRPSLPSYYYQLVKYT